MHSGVRGVGRPGLLALEELDVVVDDWGEGALLEGLLLVEGLLLLQQLFLLLLLLVQALVQLGHGLWAALVHAHEEMRLFKPILDHLFPKFPEIYLILANGTPGIV